MSSSAKGRGGDPPRLVVVLGMHRSGTSALTRSLPVLGVSLGDNLLPPVEGNNPTGFWEEREIYDLHNEMLQSLGGEWDDLGLIAADDLARWQREGFFSRAVELLRSRTTMHAWYGVKDPRISALLPFWQMVFAQCGLDVRYLISCRNPMSVARSLQSRDGHEMARGYFLWWKHYALAISGTEGRSRLFVEYDSLLEDPEIEVKRIARFLGAEMKPAAWEEYRERFIDSGLRHTVFAADNLNSDQACPDMVSQMYRELQRACMDADGTRSLRMPQCAQWWRMLRRVGPALTIIDEHWQRRREDGGSEHCAPQGEIEAGQHGPEDAALLRLAGMHCATLETWDRERGQWQRFEREWRRARLRWEELESEWRRARLRWEELESEWRGERARYQESIAALRGEGERLDELSRAQASQIRDQEARVEQLESVLDSAQQTIETYRAAEADWEHTRVLLHYARLEIEGMRGSRSWRITLPLRKAGDAARWMAGRVKAMAYEFARGVFKSLPLAHERKQRLKSMVLARLGGLAGNTMTYRVWAAESRREEKAAPPPEAQAPATKAPRGVQPGPASQASEYVPFAEGALPSPLPARLIAFYLPQFHPIAENDLWWGKGFTEWTNVTRGVPQFEGHYQPHLPADLGFYDLRLPQVQQQQVALAKAYGVSGFCFYFYWFDGKRLLEAPILQYLERADLDLPFCLCWANENWSRRWDGRDEDVLIAQHYTDDDDLAFIRYVAKYLRDPRYIRVSGRPLLIVYRPGLLPDARRTAARWRAWCRQNGVGELYLAYTQSFEAVDPAEYGFDAAIEFPPNNTNPPLLDGGYHPFSPEYRGAVYDWRAFVTRSREYRRPPFALFRGVCPSWDNEARRPGRGVVFQHASPQGYREWLGNAMRDTAQRFSEADERLVFINAWNEWAEGAHLEPDQRYGHAWLAATREALADLGSELKAERVVLVSHDAHPHGAQYLCLHLAKALQRQFGCQVDVVLLGEGMLIEQFKLAAKVHDLSHADPAGAPARALARDLKEAGAKLAIVNTTVSGLFLETLAKAGMPCISLVHELPGIIATYGLEKHARAIAAHAEKVIFASEAVARPFARMAGLDAQRSVIRPQGLYKKNARIGDIAAARSALRLELGLDADAPVVLGVGYADRRKGVDLFVDAGIWLATHGSPAHFVWVGHWDAGMAEQVKSTLSASPHRSRFHFVGRKDDTDLFYAGADVFALTSREDPFPTVILEALEVAVPVVAFEGAGGSEDLLRRGCGTLVAAEDAAAFAQAVGALLQHPKRARALGECGAKLVREQFSFRRYVFDLLQIAGLPRKRVSVAVPNYNYARYLAERLSSIESQSYPIFELLILDDASRDDSVRMIEEFVRRTGLDCRVKVNARNSGSVFRQWQLAAEMASGEYLWIGEADDIAEPCFLERVMAAFEDPGVVMSYCQSKQVDESGRILAGDYLAYTDDLSPEHWRRDFIQDGSEALARGLSVKNTIPNVSAVVFRRDALLAALKRCRAELDLLRVAGDWLVYSEVLQDGKLAFCADALNRHRRHKGGVTISNFDNARHLVEIQFMQERVADRTGLSEESRAKAREFAAQVREQFGLPETQLLDGRSLAEIDAALRASCASENAASGADTA